MRNIDNGEEKKKEKRENNGKNGDPLKLLPVNFLNGD